MITSPVLILATATAIASAAVGGLFYAFSTFVMRGLDRTEPARAITAMRGINAEAQANAPFLLLFLGSAVLAAALAIVAVIQLREPGSGYLLAGALLAIIALIVTMALNVPLNNRLDAIDPAALAPADAAREWANYLSTWTAWNHVRTVAPLLGSLLMLIGLRYR